MFSLHHLPTRPPPISLIPSKPTPKNLLQNLRLSSAVVGATTSDAESLPVGLQRDEMPRHVAVIMDGSVRWARQKRLPSPIGHLVGYKTLSRLVDLCINLNIKVLTAFAFSYDNWARSKVSSFFSFSSLSNFYV
ncbi:hypothetical protein BVRB_7g172230 [Beta vulgaris subsp. vulgaris]|nr:hypothetical protein BVRB_7g172230 [Beta vulgaris subsp. vulgaris]